MWRLLGFSNNPDKAPPPRTRAAGNLLQTLDSAHPFNKIHQTGDYLSFTIAGFSFFLTRDRSYPIAQYHGWSYGLKGNLSKAPRFETIPDFNKTQHGLLPNHPDIKWQDDFETVDQEPRMQKFDFAADYSFDHYWEMDVDANWKPQIENYNKRYHCATSHPLISGPKAQCMEHHIVNNGSTDAQFQIFYIQHMIPVTATTCKIENEELSGFYNRFLQTGSRRRQAASVREMVMEHHQKEAAQGGGEIWSAVPKAGVQRLIRRRRR
ncbi:hypothetical protein BDV12DRAFT_186086 [Aspergillus spectabilis]